MPNQNQLDKCGDAQDNLEQPPDKSLHETTFSILKDIKTTPLEFTDQQTIDSHNSQKKMEAKITA